MTPGKNRGLFVFSLGIIRAYANRFLDNTYFCRLVNVTNCKAYWILQSNGEFRMNLSLIPIWNKNATDTLVGAFAFSVPAGYGRSPLQTIYVSQRLFKLVLHKKLEAIW